VINIMVKRLPADSAVLDVHDPLLCSTGAAVERGRAEIDESGLIEVQLSMIQRKLHKGDLVRYEGDMGMGYGIVDSVQYRGLHDMSITLLKAV